MLLAPADGIARRTALAQGTRHSRTNRLCVSEQAFVPFSRLTLVSLTVLTWWASNPASEVTTDPRNWSISRRSKSSLNAPPVDSPAGFVISVSLDPMYGTESYTIIVVSALKIAASSGECGLNRIVPLTMATKPSVDFCGYWPWHHGA